MSTALVECIPNFSEARRPEVVEQILDSIRAVAGVSLLDHHSDLDHNRTVVTFVGSPQAVEEAAYQSIATAAKLIDLDQHSGEHPRIGATDVVPFVPISDISMPECVEIARRLAKRVADTLNIPTYLYEEAATRPDRQNLENIRRGQYEGLKEDILVNPERKPDFGPSQLGTAGATVIGARQALIAFNIYLTTDDVAIAQKVARAMRFSSGGFRFVKAMGIIVEGRAQVSMNLTNHRQTPIYRVVEAVRREAQRYGVGIHHCELVGLVPQEAVINSAVWYLQLDQFENGQILEQKLFETSRGAAQATETGPDFLDLLAGGTPAPGGGSAAAHTAAAGAALVAMVARLTIGKKKYADVQDKMFAIIEEVEALRADLTADVDRDAAAYEAVMTAFKLPKDTEEQQALRSQAVEAATLSAARAPLAVCHKVIRVMELALEVARYGNLNAISDGASGMALSRAALTGSGLNVKINLKNLYDQSAALPMLEELSQLETRAGQIENDLAEVLSQRAGLD